jgi:uncharacterized protein involved in outer membrane biogenesis
MKRLLALPAILLVLAAFVIFALPYLVPASVVQSRIAPSLQEQAGIELRHVDRIGLTFTPEFGLAANNVVAAVRGDERGGGQLQASRIVVSLDTGALLGGAFVLRKIRLERPILTVQNRLMSFSNADASAKQLNVVPIAYAQAQIQAAPRPIRLPHVDIDIVDGTANILNRSGRQVLSFEDATLALRHPPEAQVMTIDGDFGVKGETFRLKATASPNEVAKSIYEVVASLHSPATGTEFEGYLHLVDRPRFEGEMRSGIVSGKDLARWIGGDPAALGRLTGTLFEGRVNVTGTAFELTGGAITAPSVKSNLTITSEFGRRLEVVLADGEIYGGQSEGRFELLRGDGEATMSASLRLAGVDSEAFGRDLPGFDWLSGPVNSEMQVTGKGRSWKTILENLNGRSAFSVRNGAIEGIDLRLIVADTKEGRFDAWERRPGYRTPFEVIEASFDIKDGVGQTDDMRMTGPGIDVTGKGNVNFARQRLDYKLQTRIASQAETAETEGEGVEQKQAQFSLPLVVKGDWESPSIYPDVTQMLRDPDSISGTGELIGKSIEQLTRGNGKGDGLKGVLNDLFGNDDEPKADADGDAAEDATGQQ